VCHPLRTVEGSTKPRPPRKPLLLVVDDDGGVREALHLILDEEYAVVDAANGREAVAAVRSGPVNLVLLDILLPGVDGIEVLQELKGIAPEIPVIMVTAVKTIRTSVAAMKLGAVDYVTKPFQEEELLKIIRGAIAPGQKRPTNAERARQSYGSRLPWSRRILIVDSDPGRRATLAVMLASFGAVETTPEGASALSRLGRALNLCIVLGLARGRVGIETVRAIRAQFPACPIVVATESEDSETMRELHSLEIDEILRPTDEIIDVVHRVGSLLSAGAGPRKTAVRFTEPAAQAIKYIGGKYTEKLCVDTIAHAVGVSGSHLAHVFRVETGMTVMDFVTGVRVEIAKHLLTTTEDNLAQIAARVGFFDASHLSRAFLLTTGKRPGVFRRPSRWGSGFPTNIKGGPSLV
jgi:DNA-binding response OmpR family regulator